MKSRLLISFAMAAVVAAAGLGRQGWAQDAPAGKQPTAKPAATAPAANAPAAKAVPARPAGAAVRAPASVYKPLVPGVMRPVEAHRQAKETVEWKACTELLAQDGSFDWAKSVPFRQDVWMLNFQFKPMRMLWVDLPGPNGRMERKLVWYMVYTVTNPGQAMHAVEEPDQTYKITRVDKPVTFVPIFTLEVHYRLQDDSGAFTMAYKDQVIPVAFAEIVRREDPKRRFLTTAEMAAYPNIGPQPAAAKDAPPPRPQGIGVGETVWGIATWTGVDPRNVWFSVYVEGLTNAYQFEDDPVKYKAMLQGEKVSFRTLYHKVLKLNFWRVGAESIADDRFITEDQIRVGVLNHAVPRPTPGVAVDPSKPPLPDYQWVWRRAF